MSGPTIEVWPPPASTRRSFKLVPTVPAIIMVVIVGGAIIFPLFNFVSPTLNNLSIRHTPPVWMEGGMSSHLLGTDHLGRDVLARIVYGARVSLSVSVSVIIISATVGSALGMLAGFRLGVFDSLSMRVVDVVLSLPIILLAIVFAVVFGPSITGLVGILAGLLWAQYARIARGETLSLRHREYVLAAITLGYRQSRILLRHVLPNLIHTIVVVATLQLGTVILLEASLSFLGVGVPPPTPTWGRMIADGRNHLVTGWWAPVGAGVLLATVIICMNLLGDYLRDRLDPQMADGREQSVF